jgi:hypothetical protein
MPDAQSITQAIKGNASVSFGAFTSAKTHRTFWAAAIGHSVKRLLWREQGLPGDLLLPSFGNVAVPAQILPLLRNETRPPPIYSDA